ncbi:MAG: hypothetical protein J2P13_01000 [Acidobacteria bacterium]|nr:hypothetical protein [Acidobacteriota bacterium]
MEFLADRTRTPVAIRYAVSFERVKEIAIHFLTDGASRRERHVGAHLVAVDIPDPQ